MSAPFAMQQILEELEIVKYVSVMVSISDESLKLVPVLDWCFVPRKGVQTEVIEFYDVKVK